MEHLMTIVADVIRHYGYGGIFALTTLEQFIFPVPADVFVAIGTSLGLSLKMVLFYVLLAALTGSYIGYFLGRFLGLPVVRRLFGQKRLDKGEAFIKRYGMWGVIVAGLTPIPFKIVTWTAGIFEMPLGRFTLGVLLGRMPRYIVTGLAASFIYKTKFYASTSMSAIILGTLQGITEFLPISSSGHLAITEHFLKLPVDISGASLDVFDIFLHGGSLLAIVLFFWKDWIKVFKESWKMLMAFKIDFNSLAFKLALGTVPAIIAGVTLNDLITNHMRGLAYVAGMLMLVSVYFLLAEWKGGKNKLEAVGLKKTFIIGISQAVALIPGVSRSGTTIATGMLCGLNREASARFSFMLGGVAILAANVYALFSIRNGVAMPDMTFTLIGAGTSFLISLVSIRWLLSFLKKHTLRPFSFYLMILGSLILMLLELVG